MLYDFQSRPTDASDIGLPVLPQPGAALTDEIVHADEAEQGDDGIIPPDEMMPKYDLEQLIASASPAARRGIESTIASIRVYNELAEKLADGEAPPTPLLAGSSLLVSYVHVPES